MAHSSRDGGLFFNMFSFVSREIQSFVVNATGGQASESTKPSRKRRKRLERQRNPSEDDARKRCRGRDRTKTDGSRPKSRSKSTDASKRHHRTKPIPPPYAEDADAELSASDRSRSPQPTLKKKPSITMPGSLFPRSSSLEPDASTSAFISPWRSRPVASVHDAVQRFNITDGEEADFSLRLPTPHSSPVKPLPEADTSLRLAPPSSSAKGKERMQDDDLLYILGDVTGGDTRIRAKERELVAAKEEHQRHSGGQSTAASDERERDKERIRILEEEVKRLREELRCRTSNLPPPPPPPPPIPPPLPIRIDTSSSDQSTMFASARAALRHTSPPREAPINAATLTRTATKRQGQPTFNVPSDKMAAFLNEIKTARLRKVGSGPEDGAATPGPEPSNLSKSTSALSWASGPIRPEISRRRSLANLGGAPSSAKETLITAGRKRKADEMGMDELVLSHAAKRRLTQVSTGGSSSSGSSASTSKPWSSQETDITTPSLCSDNERDGDGSLEDQVPSTPPGPRSTLPERRREPEIAGSNTRPQSIRVGSPPMDMFEKRPPMSPIPHPTPRKPSAPARSRRVSTPKPKYIPPDSDSDSDKDADRANTPFLSLIPVGNTPSSRPSSRRASKNDSRTLDEELRSAGAGDDVDLFMGTGTMSKRRGFLARGGAGGPPVLMGTQVSDGEVQKKDTTRRIHKSTSQGSLIPRLGGKS